MRAVQTFIAVILGLVLAGTAIGQGTQPSIADSFRIGTGGGALCQAQSLTIDPMISGLFDRAWTVVCRDAPKPIGKLYQIRLAGDPAAALAKSSGASVWAAC